MEPSSYFDKHGMKWKGNNLYMVLPIHSAVDTFHQRQLRKLELDMARSRLAAQNAVALYHQRQLRKLEIDTAKSRLTTQTAV